MKLGLPESAAYSAGLQDNNRRAFAGELAKGEARFVFGNEERNFYNVVAPIHDRKVGGIAV